MGHSTKATGALSIYKAIVHGVANQCRRGRHFHLCQNVGSVRADGRDAYMQFLSDLGHRFP